LFAKHFKLAEHVGHAQARDLPIYSIHLEQCTYCEKTKFSIGAGTPDRIVKLIEASTFRFALSLSLSPTPPLIDVSVLGALSLDEMTHLIIDMKKDSKKRHILDIPESRTALFKLLNSEKVNERLKAGKMKLVMF
jgi:hypothetical protein